MAFMGEMTDVGVADLLSVLARRGLSGRLNITAEGEEVAVVLNGGKVTQITSSNQSFRLGRILLRLGVLSEADLNDAVREQAELVNARPLGQILTARGMATQADLARAAEEQATDALAYVFGKRSGTFFFTGAEDGKTRPGLVELHAEGIVLEASRRADEIEALWKIAPPPDAMLKLNRSQMPLGNTLLDSELRLTRVLAIEEVRTAELITQTVDDARSVLRALVSLIDRGIVEVVSGAGVRENPPSQELLVTPRTPAEIRALIGAGVGSGRREWVPGLAEVRKAEPAGTQTIARVTRVVREAVGAFNAGLPLMAYAHFTDAYFRRLSPITADELDTMDGLSEPIAAEQHQTFIEVIDVRVLVDGRISAIVVTSLPDEEPTRKVVIFVEEGDRCLIDVIVESDQDRSRITQTTMLSPSGLLARNKWVLRRNL
jgi:hypothetical protein